MVYTENIRRRIAICGMLGALTLAAFWPVVHQDFCIYDDPYYITANPHVLGGLTLENAAWAFQTGYYGNWFPVTWLSHMMDLEIFGLAPGRLHLTNLLFHLASTLLLFRLVERMTGAAWRSGLVAALFALHPLRVESVAWIAERKDVLSTFFFMLTLWAYARYTEVQSLKSKAQSPEAEVPCPTSKVQSQGTGNETENAEGRRQKAESGSTDHASRITDHASRYYLLSLLFFALGLMSKAMVVTAPFVLLLLDFWPLRRLKLSWFEVQGSMFDVRCSEPRFSPLWPLLREKIPFLVLAVFSSAITFWTQKQVGAMKMLEHFSFGHRSANALLSYVRYIGKLIWPVDLAVLYPHQQHLPAWQVGAAAALILALSIGALRLWRARPYVTVGWFWFVGTLVPAIGLVQVGEQAMADRFTYIPSIGLIVLMVWWVSDIGSRGRYRSLVLGGGAILVVALLVLGTRVQLNCWRTSKALLEHDISVTGGTAVIHNNLGTILVDEGNWPEAERQFSEALRLDPTYARARINLATGLARQDKAADAARQLRDMEPVWEAEGHRQLAKIFLEQMKVNEAIEEYSAAATLEPDDVATRESLGLTLAHAGKAGEASAQFAELVRLRPDAQAHYYLALSLVVEGKAELAAEHYRETIRLKPDWPEPLNDLAWLLATSSRAALRNGPEAVQLAEQACDLSGHKEARFLGTLDAAYAEAGRFAEAITVAEQARTLAQAAGNQEVATAAASRLELYRAGRAYHQP